MHGLATMKRFGLGVWAVLAVSSALVTAPVAAQANPELGEGEGEEPPPVEGARISNTWQPPTGEVDNSAAGAQPQAEASGATAADGSFAASAAAPDVDDGVDADAEAEDDADDGEKSDHQKMIGSLGVGFFGTQTVPVMGCNAAAGGCPAYDDGAAVIAPTIGARYWWKRWIGFEAAIGFNHTSGDTELVVTSGNPPVSTTTLQVGPTVTAFAMHLAVPFALADSGHFVFEVMPELNFGISGGSYEGATAAEDWNIKGSMVEFGGRIGGEIHFGFIGIPQLALQATIGLHLRHESRSATQEGIANPAPPMPPIPKTDIDQSRTVFSTTLQGEPWDIFGGAITAIYYL